MPTFPRPALIAVALVSAVRLLIAFHVPLTEDESYYWTWSRHLAFGYTDHPPMTAWLIALTTPLGHNPGWIRLPFIACEAFAALALCQTALLLGGGERAGTAAAIAFMAIPQVRLAIGEALPDGPYLLCWSLALMFTAALTARFSAANEKSLPSRALLFLGLALGGTLLSRFFGWALLGGVIAFTLAPERRAMWKRGFWLAPLIALALYVPFILWNAHHHWVNFTFTVRDRQSFQAFSLRHLDVLSTARFLVYAVALWVLGFFVALRSKNALIAWTALPFPAFLACLSFFEVVESYWLLGSVASLCVGIGLAYARRSPRTRRGLSFLLLPAMYTMASALFLTLPEPAQGTLLTASRGTLNGWYSGVFAYRPLASDVARLLRENAAVAMTDHFEIASELTYYGLDPLIIGRSPQVWQWLQWHNPRELPDRALMITVDPLERDADLSRIARSACASIRVGPTLRYRYAGLPAETFYTAWCSHPRRDAAFALYGSSIR